MNKFANVTYIENDVSKEMIIEMRNAEKHLGSTFPKLWFHLFKSPGRRVNRKQFEHGWEVTFMIEATRSSEEAGTVIYKDSWFLETNEDTDVACGVMLTRYQRQRNAGFIYEIYNKISKLTPAQ